MNKVEYRYVHNFFIKDLNEAGKEGWKPSSLVKTGGNWRGMLWREVENVVPLAEALGITEIKEEKQNET